MVCKTSTNCVINAQQFVNKLSCVNYSIVSVKQNIFHWHLHLFYFEIVTRSAQADKVALVRQILHFGSTQIANILHGIWYHRICDIFRLI